MCERRSHWWEVEFCDRKNEYFAFTELVSSVRVIEFLGAGAGIVGCAPINRRTYAIQILKLREDNHGRLEHLSASLHAKDLKILDLDRKYAHLAEQYEDVCSYVADNYECLYDRKAIAENKLCDCLNGKCKNDCDTGLC